MPDSAGLCAHGHEAVVGGHLLDLDNPLPRAERRTEQRLGDGLVWAVDPPARTDHEPPVVAQVYGNAIDVEELGHPVDGRVEGVHKGQARDGFADHGEQGTGTLQLGASLPREPG